MAYDLHGPWDGKTGLHSGLYASNNDPDKKLNAVRNLNLNHILCCTENQIEQAYFYFVGCYFCNIENMLISYKQICHYFDHHNIMC